MSPSHPTPAEQHLGDRLAALVDGELGHDARERVLAHLATCPKCKAEADAQRRLKNVFAAAAPPPPSESFLARLHGLPGVDDSEQDPFGGGGFGGGSGVLSMGAAHPLKPRPRTPLPFTSPGAEQSPALPAGEHGFRIHDVGRQEAERWASRSRRFAFAAAGAVSLAAIALGGVSTGMPATAGSATQGGPPPSNATPMRATGPAAVADAGRRRGAGQPVTRAARPSGTATPASAATIAASAPQLPGMLTPPRAPDSSPNLLALLHPSLGGAAPLLRALPTAAFPLDAGAPTLDASAPPSSGMTVDDHIPGGLPTSGPAAARTSH